MKKMTKPALIAASLAGVSIMTLGVAGVSAATNTNSSPEDTLATKIATKFNLDKSQVQAVFDEERSARQAERQKALEDRLTQAVKDGKLTENQKAKILAKAQEMKTFHESLKDKTPEERRQAMETHRNELKQWAEDNDIPTEYFRMGMGHGGHGMGPRE